MLGKEEVDIKGLVQTELNNAKVKWMGWPEGAILEELDLNLVNNTTDTLKDIHIDVSIKGPNHFSRLDKLPAKKELKGKENTHFKVHLFKYLKTRGKYYITIRTYSTDPVREYDLKEKTITI